MRPAADLSRRLGAVLVANRGEIAVRVLLACRRLGLEGIAVYADPDAGALHVRSADRAEPIGGERVTDSYLDVGKLLAAARRAGAGAVHPGYGLLSEQPGFAAAVEAAGLVWVGPPPAVIAQMGDKLTARALAARAGVAPVPGTQEPVREAAEILAFAAAHGWPVAVKAAAGGGGRGIRVVTAPDEAGAALAAARAEALAAFGDDTCYLERFFRRPRHVEVQVLADRHGGAVHLGERDCSVQRRHQKLLEETPAPDLPDPVREDLHAAALRLTAACGYAGAGTVEFLWDPDSAAAFFLEMNTRLQVEHPITEEVTGIDLVAAQLAVAAGEPLSVEQPEIRPRGHAIECRINAEDPAAGFVPRPGRIDRLRWPGGPEVRVDAGYEAGDTVSTFYDDLLGKVICWGHDRPAAIERMRRALADLDVAGVGSTGPALTRVLEHPDFEVARHWTTWVEERLLPEWAREAADPAAPDRSPRPAAPDLVVRAGGRDHPVRLFRHRPSSEGARAGGDRGQLLAPLAGTVARIDVQPGDLVSAGDPLGAVEAMKMETQLVAPASGRVVAVLAGRGDPVAAGDVLVIVAVAGAAGPPARGVAQSG